MASQSIPRDPLQPAERVSGQKQDVWSIVNAAAAASPVQPIVNMGQGFFGYNPPPFVIDAAKRALDQVECNQYSPTRGRPRLKKALAAAYSPFFNRQLDPDTEITISTGANEGMLCAFMAFVEPGDEVILFEPFFDQYSPNIEMAGGAIKYVPFHPPARGDWEVASAGEWTVDIEELRKAITPKTRMMVLNSPHNPVGKVFTREELLEIGNLCVEHSILILSDEVYDALYYKPFTRIATLSPAIDRLTLSVGSAGKSFYATGWRVGWLIGREHLIKYVAAAHTRICYNSPSPLQEAAAVGFEEAKDRGFWEQSKRDMSERMERFNAIWGELGLPYSVPEGGYFVMVNMKKVQMPHDYDFPSHVAERPRDFHLSWFLTKEIGVAAIPPTEFYTPAHAHMAENYLRFAFCKPNDVLDLAKERLRGLKKYIGP
ncbi:MAG: putative secondary metabolism biosynthetic enzyme [Thelocarpon superellum]|nr:MAG: putative secondary metabolism biosynthetic enzyme [Thelocarpon superellum]